MPTDRRAVLALSGAFLAGLAGCTGTDDDPPADEPTGDDGTDATDDDANGDDASAFDGDAPDFPALEFVTEPDLEDDLLADQIRGNVDFALAVLAQLRDDRADENLFCSPYSISVALAMTYAGARGETAAEMADALRYVLEGEDLHAAFGALEDEFERRNEDGEALRASNGERTESASDGQGLEDPYGDGEDENGDELGFELSSANAVWPDEGLPMNEAYLELLEVYYGAGEHLVDFVGSPEGARREINEWVAERTNDRTEDLLPENSVDASTRLVLTSAVYFLAAWEYDFDPANTGPAPFTSLDGTETGVDLMRQTAMLPYAEVDGHQLVELPYANDETSMVVLLPAEGEFEAFEDALSVDRLATMLEETSYPEVDLALPTFGIESKFSLVDTMRELGMERAFGGGAEFGGMLEGDGGLFVDDVVHQSFVEVDEEGTEAAASTAVIMGESAPPDQVEMTVDRPFLFYIRDRPTETPLFWGRVVDGETLQE